MNETEQRGEQPSTPPPLSENPSQSTDRFFSRAPLAGRGTTIALVALVLAADLCLYHSLGGAGAAALLTFSAFTLALCRGARPIGRAWFLGLLLLALAAVLLWSAWWLAVATAFAYLFVYAVSLWRPEWSFLESALAGSGSALHAPVRLVGHVARLSRPARREHRSTLPLRNILIPAAITLIFGLVLAAANPVVGRGVDRAWEQVSHVLAHLGDYVSVGRLLFWLFWLLFFAALISPVVHSDIVDRLRRADEGLRPGDDPRRDDSNFQVALITLLCLNALFLAYNVLDAVYLYFKAALPVGITWTAYTHQGCGWLTFGLLLSTVVLGTIFWRSLNFHPRSAQLKRWAYAWIALNAVLAVGTLRRIYMYIDYSGLTHLLLTGVYGALLVMAGLVIMAVKVHGNRNAVWLLRSYTAAFATGLTLLALTPHGYLCARYNVPRILADKPQAMWPVVLKTLPADALPPVIALLDYRRRDGDEVKQRLVREGIASILGEHLARLERQERRGWSRWQASSWWALRHLRAAKDRIHATAPPARWAEARNRLASDYDLMSGAPPYTRPRGHYPSR